MCIRDRRKTDYKLYKNEAITMKTKKLTIAIALMAMTFIGTSCGNKQQKSASEAVSYTHLEGEVNSKFPTGVFYRGRRNGDICCSGVFLWII